MVTQAICVAAGAWITEERVRKYAGIKMKVEAKIRFERDRDLGHVVVGDKELWSEPHVLFDGGKSPTSATWSAQPKIPRAEPKMLKPNLPALVHSKFRYSANRTQRESSTFDHKVYSTASTYPVSRTKSHFASRGTTERKGEPYRKRALAAFVREDLKDWTPCPRSREARQVW